MTFEEVKKYAGDVKFQYVSRGHESNDPNTVTIHISGVEIVIKRSEKTVRFVRLAPAKAVPVCNTSLVIQTTKVGFVGLEFIQDMSELEVIATTFYLV